MREGQHHPAEQPAEPPTELLHAVLAYCDALERMPDSRIGRVADRLDRLHLSWLLIPWYVVLGARWLRRRMPPSVTGEDRAVTLYRQAAGTDRDTAAAEVNLLVMQLGLLGNPGGWPVPDGTVRPGGAERAEVEAAAAALLGYYLAGRRTDDGLLGEVMAVWAEHEDQMFHGSERLAGRGLRRREVERALMDEVGALVARYLVAWRRWFDAQPQPGGAGPAGR